MTLLHITDTSSFVNNISSLTRRIDAFHVLYRFKEGCTLGRQHALKSLFPPLPTALSIGHKIHTKSIERPPYGGRSTICYILRRMITLHVAQPAQHIVEVGHNEQHDEQGKASILGADEKFLGRFAPRDHLIE